MPCTHCMAFELPAQQVQGHRLSGSLLWDYATISIYVGAFIFHALKSRLPYRDIKVLEINGDSRGEMVTALLFLAAVGCLISLTAAQQAGCSNIPTSAQVAILIAHNYLGSGQGSLATITLQSSPFGYRVVCSSSSGVRNQYRFVSIVAYYTTSDGAVSPPGVPIYGQFEFECIDSAWSSTSSLSDNPSKDRTMLLAGSAAITANSTTNCAYCLKQSVSSPERVSDDTNHCSG